MAINKNLLTRWIAGQTFTARDYVYERDLIIDEVNRVGGLVDDLLAGQGDLTVNSLTINDSIDLNVSGFTINSEPFDKFVRGNAVYSSTPDQYLQDGDIYFEVIE